MSKTLKILSRPQRNAEEYGRWAVNPYKGCSHGCLYCYLKKGVWANGLGGSTAELKSGVVNEHHAFHLAMAEIIENREEIVRDGGLFMTFTGDPCAPETFSLFSRIASRSMDLKIPITMLTKNAEFCGKDNHVIQSTEQFLAIRDWLVNIKIFQEDYQECLAIGFTLTGHDELEPNASPNAERIEAIKYLNGKGWHTWASIEPAIDFPSALDMVYQAVNAGCQHFKIGLLTNNTRVVRKDFAFGEHHFDAYKVNDCLHFVEDVMRVTSGKATVYWKQSVRDLLETTYTPAAVDELLNYPHSVGKDWNMFYQKQ